MKGTILGIHYGHDATVALMVDGTLVEAMSEERVSRQKKHAGFPHEALAYIIEKYNCHNPEKVVVVGVNFSAIYFTSKQDNIDARNNPRFSDDFIRAMGARFPILGKAIKARYEVIDFFVHAGKKESIKKDLKSRFPHSEIEFVEHHHAHAWCAPLFFDDASKKIILTLDGAGDLLSGTISLFDGRNVKIESRIPVYSSLGLLYSAVTDILGMSRNEHEFKVMGLAPYAKASSGEKVYQKLKKLVWFDEREMQIKSSIDLDRATSYLYAYNFHHHRFDSLAYGIQKLTEEIIKDMARATIKKYGISDIAVAGGVFMNVKANQYLLELPEVTSLTVVPSCGDESLALGACAYGYSLLHKGDLSGLKKVNTLYLGSSYDNETIKKALDKDPFVSSSCTVTYFDPSKGNIIERKVAELLADNQVVGRFKGRAEWGARALGNRSILANPTSRDNIKLINEMIKGRDFWMPFATSLLYEDRDTYLQVTKDHFAPYMAITFNTKEKAHKDLIAALHPYDLTSRPQMVTKEMNKEYHSLISHFKTLTGSGGILNTSFNLHGEPNVEKPEDALHTLKDSGLKYLAIGDYLVEKRG